MTLRYCRVEVLPEVVRVGEHHVTIDEQQPGITGLGGQEIADGSTANILRTLHKPAVRQLVDGTIGDLYSHIRRTIVSHEHLIVDVQGLCLLLKTGHQRDTVVIVGGNQYGKFCHWVQK